MPYITRMTCINLYIIFLVCFSVGNEGIIKEVTLRYS